MSVWYTGGREIDRCLENGGYGNSYYNRIWGKKRERPYVSYIERRRAELIDEIYGFRDRPMCAIPARRELAKLDGTLIKCLVVGCPETFLSKIHLYRHLAECKGKAHVRYRTENAMEGEETTANEASKLTTTTTTDRMTPEEYTALLQEAAMSKDDKLGTFIASCQCHPMGYQREFVYQRIANYEEIRAEMEQKMKGGEKRASKKRKSTSTSTTTKTAASPPKVQCADIRSFFKPINPEQP
jgi:hypothetical protein